MKIFAALMFCLVAASCSSAPSKDECVDRPPVDCYGLGKLVCGKTSGGCEQCMCDSGGNNPFGR